MHDSKLIFNDGSEYVINEKFEIEGEPTSQKKLDDKLINENEKEYLETTLNENEGKIERLKLDVETDKFVVGALRIVQIPVTFVAFIGALFVAKYCILSCNLLIAFLIPSFAFGMLELPKIILKKGISKNENKVDYYIVTNALLKEDLAKVEEKAKAKVTYKKPDFIIEKIDTTTVDAYKEKYSNLYRVYNSIETVETEEKPKRKSYEYKSFNK